MTITTMDGLVAALAVAKRNRVFFPSATNVAGGIINLNQAVTGAHGLLAAPTAFGSGGTKYDQSTLSTGVNEWSAGAGGTVPYLGRMSLVMATAGAAIIYDLAWAASGFSGNVNTAQNVASFAGLPTRFTGGAGLELWVGCSSAIGATPHNITTSYTNQAGTSGRTSVSTAGIVSMPANRMFQLPLQAGDTGVQSLQSLTLSAASGTAGNLWALLMKPVAMLSCPVPNVGVTADFADLGLPLIDDESCLLFLHQATTTSSGIIMGQFDVPQG